jgi:PAS domain S-box-containing protein
MSGKTRTLLLHFGGAVVFTALAILVRYGIDSALGDHLPLATLYGAVAFSVWLGGYRPALLAMVLGYLACDYLFIVPRGQGLHLDTPNLVGLILYVYSCAFIIGLGEALRVAERRAQQQRESLRVTLTSMGDAVIATDATGHVTSLNPVAGALTGWSSDQAVGRPLQEVFCIINELTRQPIQDPVRIVLAKGHVVGLANHTVLIARDGTEHPIDDSAAPIRDAEDRTVGVVLIFRDVSERRRLERMQSDLHRQLEQQVQERTAELRASEERFRLLVDGSQEHAIFMLDPTGRVASWNPGAERIKQYAASEIVGQHFSRFYPAEDVQDGKPQRELQVAIAKGKYQEEGWRVRKDGSRFWASVVITALRDESGQLHGFGKVTRDVTERRLAEENARRLLQEEAAHRAAKEYAQAIERQREQLRVTLTSIGDAVIATDADGRVTLLNPVAEALTGWTNAEAVGQPLETIFHIVNEQTEHPVGNPVARVLAEGLVVGLANHTALIARDGVARPIEDSAAPIRGEYGEVIGVVLVFRDATERRSNEEALRRIQEELQIVTDCMSVPVTRCSRDLKYLWVSKPYADWIGRPAAQIMGSPIIDIIGPQAFAQLRPHFEQVLSGREVRYEERIDFHGIGPRWINVVYTPTLDAQGVSDGWVAVVIDVDNRKRMEAALRASEERLAAELEAMTQMHGLSTRLVACADLGTALEDVLDGAIRTTQADFGNIQLFNPEKKALEIVVQRGFQPDFLDYFRTVRVDEGSACAQAMKSGARSVMEDVQQDPSYEAHRAIAAAAGYRGVQSTPIKSRTNRILGMLSTHFRQPHRVSERDQKLLDLYARHAADFIERLRDRDAVGESERLEKERAAELEAILRATPTPIWIAHDPQCHRITGNPASFELLGLAEGTNVSATVPGHDPGERGFREYRDDQPIPGDELPVQRAARGELVKGADVKFVFNDGRVRYIYGNAVPLRNPDGSVRGSVAAFADVTALKEAERALQEADLRKNEFLATLAHELRNPLAPIRTAVDLLRRADGNGTVVEQARSMMGRQLDQMVRLIDDLLDVSRISQGKVQLRKQRVELATVIRSALETVQPLLAAQAHELTVTLPSEAIYLDADSTRLAQVISNLLNNAVKYTEKGGRIWLTAERQGHEAVVSVRDTGIGIAGKHLPLLFELFSQVTPALERSQGGLGIGLSLVRGLVELHGGTVKAQSDGIGRGSEFIVRLPIVELPPVQEPRDLAGDGKAVSDRNRRILVVDDNRDAADSLAMMLEMMGHETSTAYDGQEAVQAAATFRPEVILLDIGLPKMNGYEVARHIRQQEWGKGLALIALTGWGQAEDKRRALEAGFDHHLTKPVAAAALEKLLAPVKPDQRPVGS